MSKILPFVLLFAVAGCDSTEIRPGVFDPFDTSRAFSVYAVLDATEEEHTIRVQTIRRESDPPQTADEALLRAPRVVTVDNVTRDSVVWSPSVQQLSDGTYAAFYTARYEPSALRTVELFLTRPDGRDAYGQAQVPEGELAPEVIGPMDIDGQVVIEMRWTQFGALREALATVTYRLDPAADFPSRLDFEPTYDTAPGAEPVVPVSLSEAAEAIRSSLGITPETPVYLYGVTLAVEGTSPGWTSAGGDPVLAAESGNMDGAVGRFGFVDEGRANILPSPDWIERAGFTPAP